MESNLSLISFVGLFIFFMIMSISFYNSEMYNDNIVERIYINISCWDKEQDFNYEIIKTFHNNTGCYNTITPLLLMGTLQ